MTTEQLVLSKREEILRVAAGHEAYNVRIFGSVAGGETDEAWPIVPIDRPERSDYGIGIYSPSDQPVTASAGVFSFTSAPSIRSQNAHRRGFTPADQAWELDAAIAAKLRELGYGG